MESNMKAEDYTIEYCPFCEQEVAIRSHGVTACPACGKPLAPFLYALLSAMAVVSQTRVHTGVLEEHRMSLSLLLIRL